jgi:hypothetical protein
MLEPLRNPANWDNFRKGAVLVLILWAAASAVLCIIYFFILGGRSPARARPERRSQVRWNSFENALEAVLQHWAPELIQRSESRRSEPGARTGRSG